MRVFSTAGLSERRVRRMHDVLADYVDRGELPGLVTAISRHGEAHVDAIGTTTVEGDAPMTRDTIFRMTSMTKPVTAAAAMILVEECRLRLDDPVDELLPELADPKVLRRPDAELDDTVPAHRPITPRDLLTFRFGFGQEMVDPDAYPILRAERDLRLMTLGPPMHRTPHEPDEWIRRLGTLPLMRQPGEAWLYNTGSHVLGVLIARAAGEPFESFLRERIFEPLGMTDTGFTIPPSERHRFAPAYQPDAESGRLDVVDAVDDSQWSRPPAFPDGSAGLLSTIDDYLAFGQMLLDGGRRGTERILSRPSVETMTTNQLTPEQQAEATPFLDGRGWGFGVAIVTRRDDISAVPGRFGWDGGFGTSWASDPTEDMVGVLLTQRLVFPRHSNVGRDFWTLAYQAIDD